MLCGNSKLLVTLPLPRVVFTFEDLATPHKMHKKEFCIGTASSLNTIPTAVNLPDLRLAVSKGYTLAEE